MLTHRRINGLKKSIKTYGKPTVASNEHGEDRCQPIKYSNEDVFPSIVKSTPMSSEQPSLTVKYEIHSLLVDTQNYYKQLQIQHPKPPAALAYKPLGFSAPRAPAPTDGRQAPNQLFRNLEAKVQQQAATGVARVRSLPEP